MSGVFPSLALTGSHIDTVIRKEVSWLTYVEGGV